MNAVEAIGLVKMDLLGNRALSEIVEAGRWVASGTGKRGGEWESGRGGEEDGIANSKLQISNCKLEDGVSERLAPRPKVGAQGDEEISNLKFQISNIKLEDDLDPHDPDTAKLTSAGDTLGVFQAESPGMRNSLPTAPRRVAGGHDPWPCR